MFVRLFLKSNQHLYIYEKVNLLDIVVHKFPSGRTRKCLNLVLEDGTSVNFCFSEVSDLIIEDYEDQRHPFDSKSKVIFVEDGQAYEKRFCYGK